MCNCVKVHGFICSKPLTIIPVTCKTTIPYMLLVSSFKKRGDGYVEMCYFLFGPYINIWCTTYIIAIVCTIGMVCFSAFYVFDFTD